ncbi:MAG: hypothetical protein HRT87_02105 [Legionellales bacterium]|nr:hypothetical protein [Legionellales bacterium]
MKKFFFVIISTLFVTNTVFSAVSQIVIENTANKKLRVISYDPSNLQIPQNALGAYRLFSDILLDSKRRVFDLPANQTGTINVNNEANVDFGSGTVYIGGITEGAETDTTSCCSKFLACLSCCVSYVNSVGLNGCRITESNQENAVVKISIGSQGYCTCIAGENCQSTTDPIGLTTNQSGITISSNLEIQTSTQIKQNEIKDDSEIR